jgi:hypothetical protein
VAEEYPAGLLYHPDHDWARIEDGEATFGITWFAQDSLGEVVFFEPPSVGAEVSANRAYAEVVVGDVAPELVELAYDPQTAGGLLVSLPATKGPSLEAEFARAGLFLAPIGAVEEGAGVVLA